MSQLEMLPEPLHPWQQPHIGVSHLDATDTEAKAAKAVTPRTGTGRWKVLQAIVNSQGLTDWEIAQATGLRLYTAAPRRGELLRMGWIEDSGTRRPTDTGTQAIVWRLSERGRREMVA